MAEVLEAMALGEGGFSRRVAIKRILPEHVTDPSFVRMFIDEARIASRLHHANVVAVLDFGVADEVPFQILEFVDGVDAKTLADQGRAAGAPMPIDVALHVCTEIAHALHHAHEAKDPTGRSLGIVHRDVSPHNFLISWEGDVKLSDFGIAVARDRQEKTQTGLAKGKLSYMAPEQALGAGVDARTDVFALGCALHALLAERSPLSNEDALAKLLTGTKLPLDPTIPEDVRSLIARAVARSKTDRWESAAAMGSALGELFASRAKRDGRTLLRDWLAKVRTPERKAGKLDALLDVEIVLADEKPDGTRRFELAATQTKAVLPRRPARTAILGVAGALALGAVAWLARNAIFPSPKIVSAPTAVASSTATAAPTATATPVVVAAVTAKPRASATRTPVPVPVVSASPAFFVVAGEAAARGEVYLDGKKLGWAHETLQATAGSHRLEVVASGKRYAKSVELRETHTRINPWKWIVSPKDELR